MRIAVLGAGGMGRAAVHDLARAPGVDEIVVADRDPGVAEEVARLHGQGLARPLGLDVADGVAVRRVLGPCDAAIGCISYRFNADLSEAAIDTRTHWCDLGGNNDVVARQFAMSDRARSAGVALIPDTGLAPGMVSILAARCIEVLPGCEHVRIRVGGLPATPTNPPWNYQIVFSVEGLVNEYKEPTVALQEGQIVVVPLLGDLETLSFPAPFEQLEAFNTSGGASTLPWTLKDRLRSLDYKTIRYPGHRDALLALFTLGLADEVPETVEGASVRPRGVLEHHMRTRFSGSAPDVILLRVQGSGAGGQVVFQFVDHADPVTGLTAMMRCTAFPSAILAHMLASGAITERGTLHQELAVPAGPFVEALRARGIRLEEVTTPS